LSIYLTFVDEDTVERKADTRGEVFDAVPHCSGRQPAHRHAYHVSSDERHQLVIATNVIIIIEWQSHGQGKPKTFWTLVMMGEIYGELAVLPAHTGPPPYPILLIQSPTIPIPEGAGVTLVHS